MSEASDSPFMGHSGTDEVYFAAKKPEETAGILMNKAQSFFNTLRSNAYLDKLVSMWRAYHGVYGDGLEYDHQVRFTGEEGELTAIPVNHFRNIARHMYTMITSNRPIMEARAINTDYKSEAQTYLANGILDYYMREKHLEDYLKKACEMAIVLGAGFIKMEWNATAGEIYEVDPDTNEPINEGEIEFSNVSPFDVIVDGTKESWNNDWVMVRTYKNRFDLMAKYPELAHIIKGLPSKREAGNYRIAIFSNDETDDVPVYEFFHRRSEALPDGRYILFLDSNCILMDAKLPYRVIPIFRIAPSDVMGTPYGYSDMFDIFPIQEAINSLYSTILTNQSAFGVQNLFVPRGADINVNSLNGALNIIEGNAKPEPLNLTETPAEVFKFLEMMIQSAETISGVNSVARGNPEASLKSGTALALVQSMALQFISGLQGAYVNLMEQTGTSLINILKDFSTTPKMIALVGKNNRTYMKEFTGEQISAINRVIVDVGNPLSRCLKKDTPILMFDGTIKMVQDIKIGDLVMGPDSKHRTVSNINSDQEMMYDVTSVNKYQRVNYGCNESHILSLKYCSDDGRHGLKKYQKVDMSIKEYLGLAPRHRRLFMGYKTGVDFSKKETTIPPYILGTWLGDGNSANTGLTTMDNELSDAWINYANNLGLKIRVVAPEDTKAKVYYITSGLANGHNDRNPFQKYLRELNLINNKHIPNNYLTSSREDRLQLLAGFIDTDGTLIDNMTFVITQKCDVITENFIFLARSLGFRVTTKKRPSDSGPTRDGSPRRIIGEVNVITIGGNTWEIPTKLPRKQATKIEKSRDWLNYGIKVTPVGIGTFYGFTLKEEPHFLLGDFTVTHNTTAGRVQMAEQMLQMKVLKSPEQYFQVLNTGRLDATFEGEMKELLLIKSENERMLDGEEPLVTPFDEHRLHILEHRATLADPDMRKDPELARIVSDHIQKHMDALRNTDPDLLTLLGQQPIGPVGGSPAGQDQGPGPSQASLNGPMAQEMMPQQGSPGPGGSVQAGGQPPQTLPNLPRVNPHLLPNPELQQLALGNLKK